VRRLDFTPEALADLEEITAFISLDSPAGAIRVRARIIATLNNLAFMPAARAGRNAGTYEKPVRGLPYIIAFELPDKQTLRVLRIIHGARDWPAGGWPD
jgi:toxin ParE1/3/4